MQSSEHDSELGQWQTAQRAADPRLRAYVHGYFASSSTLRVEIQERHLPSLEVPLLVNFGAPHFELDAANGRSITHDGAWVVGLHARHQITRAVGERHFMVVRFTPIGAHLFLRLPMHLIANGAIDLEQIDPALARTLEHSLSRARTWAERFAAMEALIARRIANTEMFTKVCTKMSGAVPLAWRRLVSSDGRIALGALADELDCSHRTLIARFRTCVGLSPKTVARLLRFNRVVRALDRSSPARANESVGKPYIESAQPGEQRMVPIHWADIATDCGYFDQAHLIKDFREFAGSTPDAFLKRVSQVV